LAVAVEIWQFWLDVVRGKTGEISARANEFYPKLILAFASKVGLEYFRVVVERCSMEVPIKTAFTCCLDL
jgi:hypothetical protein